ncbi:prepilin-type N-terminal cleavage/methylation domain-containing protein [Candidatus Saccharibacteria bacterium]|nr:prepilin-type N-terminal cleavage/methylation domain-containing protein [Candidatus Saccharibacteria bacterium]
MKHKSAFTLVELTIAIAYMSILILSVALVISDTIASYRKGISMKLVNSAGRDLIEDFTSTLNDSPAISYTSLCATYYDSSPSAPGYSQYQACIADNAYNLIYQQWYADISTDNGATFTSTPVFGAFCTGKYSYLWNTGYTIADGYLARDYTNRATDHIPHAVLSYTYESVSRTDVSTFDSTPTGHNALNFRLLKIPDPLHAVCASRLVGDSYSYNSDFKTPFVANGDYSFNFEIRVIPGNVSTAYPLSAEPAELLPYSGTTLALYDYAVFRPAQNFTSKRLFYSASIVLATISGGVNAMSSSNYCSAPSDFSADFDYCAVNKFNFAMHATGS